jgi:hypothetical protein
MEGGTLRRHYDGKWNQTETKITNLEIAIIIVTTTRQGLAKKVCMLVRG